MKVPCVSQPCLLQSFSLLWQDGLSPLRPWRRELALHSSGACELEETSGAVTAFGSTVNSTEAINVFKSI